MELHIFNGDCALDAWRKAGGTATAIPWRENFLEGNIPPPDTSPEDFAAIRASEVRRMMPEIDVSEEKLRRFYSRIEAQVLALHQNDSAVLWFDACMFDQLILARVMFLLNRTGANVCLICKDIIWGAELDFSSQLRNAAPLGNDGVRLYADAWTAIASGHETLMNFIRTRDLSQFPFLQKALVRYSEEFPGLNDGLGRSERQLMELIRKGLHQFKQIFFAFDRFEEFMFMGDTMCLRMLDRLVQRGFLLRKNNSEYYLNKKECL